MKLNTTNKQERFIDIFNELEIWSDKFNYLIELGEELPPMPEHLKTPKSLIEGCSSRTYFVARIENGTLQIYGQSNASIPCGMIEMLRMLFNDTDIDELTNLNIFFHEKINLLENLTLKRANAFQQMLDRIKKVK